MPENVRGPVTVTTRKEEKHKSVRIKKIVLDLHGVIADVKMVVLFEYE